MNRRTLMLAGAALVASLATAHAQTSLSVPPLDLKSNASFVLQNAYLLSQAMNEHKAEIGPALKRSMMAMSDAEKARLEERARAENMPFEALAILQTVAPFAGVSATDYEAFRMYLRITNGGGGK